MSRILASAIMASVFIFLSCTPMWTALFQLDEKFESNQLNGWVIESDMFSAKNVIADIENITFINKFDLNLKFKLPNKKKRTTFYDLDIDSIKIIMKNYRDTVFLKNNNYFFSYQSHKEITKSISFAPKDALLPTPYIGYSIYVPAEVDSLILQFDVILREAEYFSYIRESSSIERDSLRIIENKEPIIVPIELRLHKNVFKY